MTDSEFYSNACFSHVVHSSEELRKFEVAKFDEMCLLHKKYLNKKSTKLN